MKLLAVLFTIAVAFESAAQQKTRPCFRHEVCVPPTIYVSEKSPAPFNAPVRYGGSTKLGGEPYWIWIKIGEPPTPCTAAQKTDRNAYEYGCSRVIGDALFVTPANRFTVDDTAQ